MKALVKTKVGKGNMELLEVKKPVPGEHDLLVKIHACGICASDLNIDHFLIHPPFTMGHEFSGIVEEVGSSVTTFQPGDPVISLTAVETCEECEYCRQGLRMHCDNRFNIGTGRDGGMAEYLLIPAAQAFHVPESISLDEAALTEPLACVCRGTLERTNIKAGNFVLVTGPGIIGQLTLLVAKASGALVIMAGLKSDRMRLEKSLELGAHAVVYTDDPQEAEEQIGNITRGVGVDIAFECSGAAAAATLCFRALKKMGDYTQIGLFHQPVTLDVDYAVKKEINFSNSIASERTSWLLALRLLEYRLIDVKPLIGKKVPLDQWKEGFQRMRDKEDYKILLVP